MGKQGRLIKHLMATDFMGVRERVLKEQKPRAIKAKKPLEQQRYQTMGMGGLNNGKDVLIDMLMALQNDYPNDMEFGSLARKLLAKYEVEMNGKTYPYL